MKTWIAERSLKTFEERYRYDVSYMRYMLQYSPDAFFKFSKLMEASAHCETAPVEASFAAKLVGAVAEDCGPCVQLVADMAAEAGMAEDQIEAVLTRNHDAMNPDTALGFCFADAVVRRASYQDDVRNDVRAEWGETGVIDLTLGLQLGRMFPMIKVGLGFGKLCQRVEVGDAQVDVVKAENVKEAA